MAIASTSEGTRTHSYFLLEELSDFFEPSDFEASDFEELSDFDESSDLDLESLPESPFEEDEAEPVEDFLA
jgi:hypothetical protein